MNEKIPSTRGIKIFGIITMAVGILMAFLSLVCSFESTKRVDERIYTTASITEIIVDNSAVEEIDAKVFVKYEVSQETIISKLNWYISTYNVGDIVEIYYYEDDLSQVYHPNTDVVLVCAIIIFLTVAVIGAIISFSSKVRIFLARLPDEI